MELQEQSKLKSRKMYTFILPMQAKEILLF